MTLINAIEIAKQKATGNAAWTRSVEKAAAALVAGELIVTTLMDGGIVTSPRGTYRIKNGVCSCPATVAHCYHRSALRVVEMMEAAPVAAPAPRVPSRIVRSANWYGERRGNAMSIEGWLV